MPEQVAGNGKYEAADCFGGHDQIQRRLRERIFAKLDHLQRYEPDAFEELKARKDDIGLSDHEFALLLSSSSEDRAKLVVDPALFEKLACPLGMSIPEVLGPPEFRDNMEQYFENKRSGTPIAPAGGGESTRKAVSRGIPLNFFVLRLAMKEVTERVAGQK